MATLTLHAYCGMPVPLADGDLDDVRQAAAQFIRRKRRRGKPVTKLIRGQEWEVQTPEDAAIISDDEGLLVLDPIGPVRKCWHCGCDVPVKEVCDCQEYTDEWDYVENEE